MPSLDHPAPARRTRGSRAARRLASVLPAAFLLLPSCGWLGLSSGEAPRSAASTAAAKPTGALRPDAFREGDADVEADADASSPEDLLAAVERLNQAEEFPPPPSTRRARNAAAVRAQAAASTAVQREEPEDRSLAAARAVARDAAPQPAAGALSANVPALTTDEPLPAPSQFRRATLPAVAPADEPVPGQTIDAGSPTGAPAPATFIAATTAVPPAPALPASTAPAPATPAQPPAPAPVPAPTPPPAAPEPAGSPAASTNPVLDVPTIALCQRVDGFGRYTPLPSTTFFAGKPALFILYTEVEHFAQTPEDDSAERQQFVTALAQRVELFLDADGTRQFAIPEQSIRERSRSRRRDFYLVQRVELPRTLSVGKYNLKVRVTDQATGQQAERIVPIQVIADPSGRPGL